MRFECPEPDDQPGPEWWQPLLDLAGFVGRSSRPFDHFFDPYDFTVRGRVLRRGRVPIYLYEHRDTRHSLNVDRYGTAYRFVPPRSATAEDGTYRRHATFYEALDDVGLWELPWLRPDLEVYRRGLSWDERWQIWDLVLDSEGT